MSFTKVDHPSEYFLLFVILSFQLIVVTQSFFSSVVRLILYLRFLHGGSLSDH